MYKIIIKILSAFIPNREKRKIFRDKYLSKKVYSKKLTSSSKITETRLTDIENKISVIPYFMKKMPESNWLFKSCSTYKPRYFM